MPTLYRFFDAFGGIKTLESLKLRLSRPSSLNDPFDGCPEFVGGDKYPEAFRGCLSQFFLRLRSNEIGLLCFSRTWEKHLMWSHYADGHQGMALVFDWKPGPDLLRVKYDKTKAVVDLDLLKSGANDQAPAHGFAKSFSIKSPAWRYEQETRVLIRLTDCQPEGGDFFIPIGERPSLLGVI